ncbi:MAG: histidine phosphatase family protein [Staphylococcus simulans]|uniref:histidine phosphatase family protein n=1 Tax=Staphylococcus TaxID=1279 RepID=UPI0008AA4D79|nr:MULTISPECIES: histidine phosphatase family protein [Staphylococcus]MDK7926568.1 histidine phosphatase family protein [Staphylococcus simulans]MDK8315227.1 histidine phosphatase family protein [Staphylococcus simulans]OHR49164.1 phosphoglycerate mutase [Staphylococcus sp. HMSC056D08]OHS47559.1 phosphoglycerate mutase [Staphylococcus sp. HMSC65H10]
MKLYLIRHGESTANYDNHHGNQYFTGQLDVSLTKEGVRSAQALKTYFEGIHIDHIYISDLTRTIQTYENGFDSTIPHTFSPLLRERSLGEFEGYPRETLRDNPVYSRYFEDPRYSDFRNSFTQRAPGGENYSDVLGRIDEFFKDILDIKDEVVVIVAHQIWIRCCLYYLGVITEEELFDKHIENCDPILVDTENI